jgi:hypothetical protein
LFCDALTEGELKAVVETGLDVSEEFQALLLLFASDKTDETKVEFSQIELFVFAFEDGE